MTWYQRWSAVDLCYIDPPFNSKRNYNQIYNNVGREDRAQARAFIDTWNWHDLRVQSSEWWRGAPFDSNREVRMRLAMSVLVGVVAGSACSGTTAPPKVGCLAVLGKFDPRAPGFIIEYKSGVDPVANTAALSAKYSFTPTFVYTALPGFAAQLSAQAVNGISCEPVVAVIEHDALGGVASQ